ncbi:type I-E CRISPR-associated protein Cse1/CasA [Streptomyces sp. NPDC059122]|uniref:type I-E CRISPR-associated protein Cse1/CasA n=1 Tax=Streptomyces sp. NPDC059122 TaxID=3346732 RepID=UPI00369C4B8C
MDDGAEGGQGGLALPTGFPPSRRAAEAVATSALTLPVRFSKRWMIDRTIEELERFLVPAWQTKERPRLDGELIFVLDADCQTCLAGFVLTYSGADGLRVTSPGVSVDAGVTAGMGATASEDGFVRNEGSGGEQHQETSAVGTEPSAGGRSVTGRGSMVAETPVGECGPPSVDLVSMPWLPVQRTDGTVTEVSLLGLFELAASLRRLVGDVPTQEMSLLRMLLAIVCDTLDGPAEVEDREDPWLSDDPFSAVPGYLERHRERFDLFHPERPFYQVADLRTAKGEVAPLSRIVADVPVGEPFFAMRRPGVDALSCAEATRWLVHAHAYDTSGIKSAMVDDERGRSGKAYPLGVGTLDNLRGVFAEGDTLRKTLLLSLIALEGRASPACRRDVFSAQAKVGEASCAASGLPHGSPARRADQAAHLCDFSGTFSSFRGSFEGLSAAQDRKPLKDRKGPPPQVGSPFQGDPGGTIHPGLFHNSWDRTLKNLDLPDHHTHALRHKWATVPLSNGVPIHEVSRWMGHSSIKITVDRYGHLALDGSERCRQVIEATFGVHMLSGFPAPRVPGAELVLA